MRLSLYLSKQHPTVDDPQARFREHVEQVRVARDIGFDSVVTGQHFLSEPYQDFQTMALLSRLAAEAGTMRLGPCVLLLPLLNPVAVAEEMATFDVMTGGRSILGIGLGYRDIEFEAFGVDPAQKVSRFRESLDLIRRLWSGEPVEFHGKYYHVSGGQVALKPVQAGGLPVWVAADADVAVRRAARIADAWVISPHTTLPTLVRQVALYREALQESAKPFPEEFPIIRECVLADTMREAQETAARYLAGKYEAYEAWGQDKALPEGETFRLAFDELEKDRFIIGDAAAAVNEIQRYVKELGATNFFFRIQFPGMSQEQVLRSLRILGERVLPKL